MANHARKPFTINIAPASAAPRKDHEGRAADQQFADVLSLLAQYRASDEARGIRFVDTQGNAVSVLETTTHANH